MMVKKGFAQKNKENIHPMDNLNYQGQKRSISKPSQFQVQTTKVFNIQKSLQNVTEFYHQIQKVMVSQSYLSRPSPNYMTNQTDINEKMRAILIDWLVDVCQKFKMKPQSLFIAVSLID